MLLLDLPMTNALKLYDLLLSVIHTIVKKISSYESLIWDNIYLSQEGVVLLYALLVGAILGWQSKKVYQWNPLFFISLVAVIVFAFSRISGYDKGQLWVLHQPKHSALIWYENQSIHFFSDAPETRTHRLLQDFQREYPAKEIRIDSLWRWLDFKSMRLLVLDFDTALQDTAFPRADIILLKNNPKVHLERVFSQWQPKVVVADGSNAPWDFESWKASCNKAGVAFYTTAEKAVLFTP